MTAAAEGAMKKWKKERKLVSVCSQGGIVQEGHIIDYDEDKREIVLDKSWDKDRGEEVVICRGYFSVQEASSVRRNS